MLVVADAIGLYTSIPKNEGVQCVREALEERANSTVPRNYIARFLEIKLGNSIFEFNQELYRQEVGTSMDTKPAQDYANIFMAKKVDKKCLQIAEKYMEMQAYPYSS